MRLLLERGPLRCDNPTPQSPDVVERGIAFVFDQLADPGNDGFCWADQIRSASALRDHWLQLVDAAAKAKRRGRSRGASTLDRVAARNGHHSNGSGVRAALAMTTDTTSQEITHELA